MFEAFQANQKKTTGIIQWMLNSAWPEMYWQLYDSYLMPNGAFYGAKKANESLHLLYNYGDNSIHIINNTLQSKTNLEALIRLFDINSKLIFEKSLKVNIESESSSLILNLPEISKLNSYIFFGFKIN